MDLLRAVAIMLVLWSGARPLYAVRAGRSRDISPSPEGEGATLSVPEMPHAGKHHRQPGVVRRRDHLVVADRAARLDHAGGARLDRRQQAVGNGEEGVAGDRRSEEHTTDLQSLMRISYAF